MYREHVGREWKTDRYGGVTVSSGEPHEVVPEYDDGWSPRDRVFEVKDPARIEYRGKQMRARSVTVVRELTSAQVFGAAYPRGEALANAIGEATFDQAEK